MREGMSVRSKIDLATAYAAKANDEEKRSDSEMGAG